MTIVDSYSIYALLVSNAFMLAAATLAIVRFQRQVKSSSSFWCSPTGSALQVQADPGLVNQATIDRLDSLQEAVESIERLNSDAPSAANEKLPFENAVRMAQAGASLEDLVRTCGLSKGEAHLFMKVHTRSAA